MTRLFRPSLGTAPLSVTVLAEQPARSDRPLGGLALS
jgi:hypothetical protein